MATGTSVLMSQAIGSLDRVGDFALLDEQGEFHQISRYQHRKAVVMMSYHPSCEDISDRVGFLSQLNAKYADQDVEFLLLDSSDTDRAEVINWGLELPLLNDAGQLVSAALQVEQGGEVLVFNPERLSLFYRGAANQSLDATLQSLLDGDVRDTVKSDVTGCVIDYQVRDNLPANPPDYTPEGAQMMLENGAE